MYWDEFYSRHRFALWAVALVTTGLWYSLLQGELITMSAWPDVAKDVDTAPVATNVSKSKAHSTNIRS